MDAKATVGISRAFINLPEPRHHNIRHKLIDILTIALFAVISDSIAVATPGGAGTMDANGTDWFSSRRRVASGKLRHVAALQTGLAPCRRWQANSLLVAVGCLLKVACFLWKQRGKRKTVSCRVAGVMQVICRRPTGGCAAAASTGSRPLGKQRATPKDTVVPCGRG